MEPYRFALVGAGWRSEFFLRIAAALPGLFHPEGLVVRHPDRGAAVETRWKLPTYRTPEELLAVHSPEFLVSSVSYHANFEVNLALLRTGLPIFAETPPAATLEQMLELWRADRERGGRIQVAEQFHRQPHHAARLEAIRRGRIGTVHTAYVSVSHGYHGTSLIRHYLGVECEPARIAGMAWTDRVLDPGNRHGPPGAAVVQEVPQQVALLDFGAGRQAVFDFSGVQYYSYLRQQRVAVRGERGEIVDRSLHAQNAEGDAMTLAFRRQETGREGNLRGFHLQGIQLGEEWVYRNPTAPASLPDEEIAMADVLRAMGEHARGGPEVYPLRLAMQDHYLGLKIREACETGCPVIAAPQPWSA